MKTPRDEVRDKKLAELHDRDGFRARILEMCCYCIYDPYAEGTWRDQVENCTSPHCPLYLVRNDRNPYISEKQLEANARNAAKGRENSEIGRELAKEDNEISEIRENMGDI